LTLVSLKCEATESFCSAAARGRPLYEEIVLQTIKGNELAPDAVMSSICPTWEGDEHTSCLVAIYLFSFLYWKRAICYSYQRGALFLIDMGSGFSLPASFFLYNEYAVPKYVPLVERLCKNLRGPPFCRLLCRACIEHKAPIHKQSLNCSTVLTLYMVVVLVHVCICMCVPERVHMMYWHL
jgi:hypothetical protein